MNLAVGLWCLAVGFIAFIGIGAMFAVDPEGRGVNAVAGCGIGALVCMIGWFVMAAIHWWPW